MIGIISSPEFKELLRRALLDSRREISTLTTKLKEQYNKAWGNSEWLEKRLAKEFSEIITNNMLDILQSGLIEEFMENEIIGEQEERTDQGQS